MQGTQVPGQETKIPHATGCKQKSIKEKKNKNKTEALSSAVTILYIPSFCNVRSTGSILLIDLCRKPVLFFWICVVGQPEARGSLNTSTWQEQNDCFKGEKKSIYVSI